MSFTDLSSELQLDCNDIIVAVLEEVDLEEKAFHKWSTEIASRVLEMIIKQMKGYKYIVNCEIMEREVGEYFSQALTYWDPQKDGQFVVRWENSSIYVVLTVYAIKL